MGGLLSGFALAAAALVPGSVASAQGPAVCQAASLPVTGVPGSPSMAGTLCVPDDSSPSTVVVLVPGATYDHVYWDFPYRPATYDFREALNRAGYASYVVDRLGTGASSRPPSAVASGLVQAAGVHASVQALRAGLIGGHRFSRVIVGGHSLGSGIALIEAATYGDVDGLLLTGYSHSVDPVTVATGVFPTFYPAALDPAFSGDGYDPGYLTTRPGTRGSDFYSAADSDPAVIAEDEATKSVVSGSEFTDTLALAETPYSDRVSVPVLIADGSLDRLACSSLNNNCASAQALRSSESASFSQSPCLQTYLLPGSGHDVNLASNTGLYQQAVQAWLSNPTCVR
jgi:pimeloyl-ACP methyl ester carboxylesterase